MTTQHPAVDVLIHAAASYGETLFTDQAEWYAAALQEAHLLHTRRLELNAVIVALTTFAETPTTRRSRNTYGRASPQSNANTTHAKTSQSRSPPKPGGTAPPGSPASSPEGPRRHDRRGTRTLAPAMRLGV
jgi:hypothetical protein